MRISDIQRRFDLRREGYQWAGTCPACGYRGTLKIVERDGRLLWWCASCDDRAALTRAILGERGRQASPRPRRPALPPGNAVAPAENKFRLIARLWAEGRPIAGTAAAAYLAHRGLAGLDSPSLRFLADHPHAPSGTRWPVLLAAVTCPRTGALRAVHRTFLRPDGGGKAPVEPAKMTAGLVAGGAIRLAEPRGGQPLVIGEGLETAASAGRILGLPAWAAVSAGNLTKIGLPEGVRDVVIAADADPAGQRAAEASARRWAAEGRRVEILTPCGEGQDFNDVLVSRLGQGVGHAG